MLFIYSTYRKIAILCFFILSAFFSCAQTINDRWIRPGHENQSRTWGIKNGIVFSIWPQAVERSQTGSGGPRGLIRVGYNFMGTVYLINFIAIEPVVNGKMEFSEISPSTTDQKWGKMIWASNNQNDIGFQPNNLLCDGTLSNPDPAHPGIQELSVYLFVEQFKNGAYPYFKVSIRSDRPDEICFQIFNKTNGAPMERCGLTATMGNYERLRLLYLKNRVVDSRVLYKGFDKIDFIEKEQYPSTKLWQQNDSSYIVFAAPNENFSQLASWPQDSVYYKRWNWRYRPFFKVLQYWRKEATANVSALSARVNGRARYWAGGSSDERNYISIPGGVAFENFELRDKYVPGQKFYYGITRKSAEEMLKTLH